MKFGVLPAAELEAALAAAWYDDRTPGLADEFLTAPAEAFERISSAPECSPRRKAIAGSMRFAAAL